MTDVPTYIVRGEDNDWVEPPETNWWVCRDGKNVALGLSKEDADSIAAALNRQLDLEAAASEAVTDSMTREAMVAYCAAPPINLVYTGSGLQRMRAAIKAVASALLLAGEARGLERAAGWHEQIAVDCERDPAAWVEGPKRGELLSAARSHREAAAAIRALGRPA